MSDDTIYDRVSTLEDKIAIIEKHIDTLMDIHKNQLAKREVRRVKDGSY